MKKNNEKLVNYFLTVGFVIILLIILVSLLMISRFVLSEDSNLQRHVLSTKTLLEDIEEVEKNTRINETQESNNEEILIKEEVFSNFDILDYDFRKIGDKTVFVLHLNNTISQTNDYIILNITNINQSHINSKIIYENAKTAVITQIKEDNEIEIYDINQEELKLIKKENINGLILFKNEKNQ